MNRTVALHLDARLVTSAATPAGRVIRYAVEDGQQRVLIITEKTSGRLFSSAPDKVRVAVIELPAASSGSTTVDGRASFGRITAGDVQFLSGTVRGTVQIDEVEQSATRARVTVSVRFVDPEVDVLKTGFAIDGTFEAEIER